MIIYHYLSFINVNIYDIYNLSEISYYEENKDTIKNKVESKIRSSTIFSDLVNDVLNNSDYNNSLDNIPFEDSLERIILEEIKEGLKQINVNKYSDDQMVLKDEVNIIKNKFFNQTNLKYENSDDKYKIRSYVNQSFYDIYTMNSTFETMTNKLLQILDFNLTDYIVNMPNFARIFRNMSINYYKAIYSDIIKYYKLIINISNEYPLYSDNFIEDKFGELSGYAIIDGLKHLDPVCQNGECPYKIDIKNIPKKK